MNAPAGSPSPSSGPTSSDPTSSDNSGSSSRRTAIIAIAAVAILGLVAVGGALWWLFGGDTPEEARLDNATRGVAGAVADDDTATDDDVNGSTGDDTSGTSDGSDDSEASGGAAIGIAGDWVVDPSAGGDEEDTRTFAGFRIAEELVNVGATEAVGRTEAVSGRITLGGTTLESVEMEVDMTSLTTDRSQRDGRMRSALDVDAHPSATFTLDAPVDLPDGAAEGNPVSVRASGTLTLKGVSAPFEVDIDAQLVGGTVVIVGSGTVTFADHGIEVPSAPVVVSVQDTATIEFQLHLVRD